MKYCLPILLTISSMQAYQFIRTQPAQADPIIVLRGEGRGVPACEVRNELCKPSTYHEEEFNKLTSRIALLSKKDQKYGVILWALYAWNKIYSNDSCANKLEHEIRIAKVITAFIQNHDVSMHGVEIGMSKGDECFKGRHILHHLFEIPHYSPVMRDLWQQIKIRPAKELEDYSSGDTFPYWDWKTKKFLKTVCSALVEDQPTTFNKLEFLWQHKFLSQEWMRNLHRIVSQKLQEINYQLVHSKRASWLLKLWWRCTGDLEEIKKLPEDKERWLKKDQAIAQILAHPYKQALLFRQVGRQLVDSNIITQD